MKPLLAWSTVLLACAVVGFRIVTNPATPHPVTAGVIVAVLILVGVYLALAEHFADRKGERHERKVQRQIAKNLVLAFVLLSSPAYAGTVANVTSPDGKYRVQVCDCYRHLVFEITARREPNGPWYHVGANVPALQDVRNDIIVTNTRIVWVQGELASSGNNVALRSSPIDVAGFSVVISHRPAQNGVGFDLPIQKISGDRVRFRSDPFVDETFGWWVVGVSGGTIYGEVFADGFESGGKSRWQ